MPLPSVADPHISPSSNIIPQSNPPFVILNSGATGTFVASSDVPHLRQLQTLSNGPTVLSASGEVMTSTLHGTLPLSPLLSDVAQSAFVLDNLRTGTLVSLSQLCDDDCIAIFSKLDVKIVKKGIVLITGRRTSNGLWTIPLALPTHQANGILRLDKTKEELALYHHATLGSPAPSTLLHAIRYRHLMTFPGLTNQLISKHLPKSIATTLGHLDQESNNICSTSAFSSPLPLPTDTDIAPALEP